MVYGGARAKVTQTADIVIQITDKASERVKNLAKRGRDLGMQYKFVRATVVEVNKSLKFFQNVVTTTAFRVSAGAAAASNYAMQYSIVRSSVEKAGVSLAKVSALIVGSTGALKAQAIAGRSTSSTFLKAAATLLGFGASLGALAKATGMVTKFGISIGGLALRIPLLAVGLRFIARQGIGALGVFGALRVGAALLAGELGIFRPRSPAVSG